MYIEMNAKLEALVDKTDIEGLRQLAWQELRRDGVVTGSSMDVELMMLEMKEIMRLRFESEIAKLASGIVLRQIRQNAGKDLMNWIGRKYAEDFVGDLADSIDHAELGVAG